MKDKIRVEGSSHEVTLMRRWHKQLKKLLTIDLEELVATPSILCNYH
jgi:hypothetical protein